MDIHVISLADNVFPEHSPSLTIQKTITNTESSLAKLPPKKSLPPRGPGGQFIKAVVRTEPSDLSTSGESSPLDTPEISVCNLEQGIQTDSEYKVNQQLADNELEETGDRESLPGAPEPNIVLLIPELASPAIPFPTTHCNIKPFISLVQSPYQLTTLPQIPVLPMASMPALSTFKGKETENPQNFLWEVERYIYLNRITNEATKVVIFSTFIYAGSQADIWWNGLAASKKST
ncbi:hypothetical protein EDD22DRAFT_958070 [Suillus occidentalis]|nr:hypothetical protein EDD22DRAFT_958070 [Suillus occidentalis]